MRLTWVVAAFTAILLPAASGDEPDPASVLDSALASVDAAERLDALVSLVELGRLEPVRARAAALLADPSAPVRAEALVALAGTKPSKELAAIAARWLAEHDLVVDDARCVLAAILAQVDPPSKQVAVALAPEFPRARTMLDFWLTGPGPFTALGPDYPAELLPALRRIAIARLDGASYPGYQTIRYALLRARDPEVVAAAVDRVSNASGEIDVAAACELLRQSAVAADRVADLQKRCLAQVAAQKLAAWQAPALYRQLIDAGVPGAADALRARFENAPADDREAQEARRVWIESAAPWEELERGWPEAQLGHATLAGVKSRDTYLAGMLRANPAQAVPIALGRLETWFDWSVWRALEPHLARLDDAQRKRLSACVVAAAGQPSYLASAPPPQIFGFVAYVVAHEHGAPGMAAKLVAACEKFPSAEAVDALYRMDAKDAARAMATRVLERDGTKSEQPIHMTRLRLAATLCRHDVEWARPKLVPLVAIGARPPGDPSTADRKLLFVAAAVVAAASGRGEVGFRLSVLSRELDGWSAYRAICWRPPEKLDAFVADRIAAAKMPHAQAERERARPGATRDCEIAYLLAPIVRAGPMDDAPVRALVEVVPRLTDLDAIAAALRALAAVAGDEDRGVIASVKGDGRTAGERDGALWIAGDASVRPRLALALAAGGPARIPAARALLVRPAR